MKFKVNIEILWKFMLRFAGRIIIFMHIKDTHSESMIIDCLEDRSMAYRSLVMILQTQRGRLIGEYIDGQQSKT